MSALPYYLAVAILGLATAQGGALLLGSWRRQRGEMQHARLRLERLEAEIAAVRARSTAASETAAAWNGWRSFEVIERVDEGGDIVSLHLAPHDRKSLPSFKPGQYLTFQFRVPDQPRPVVRCYSLSAAPHAERYRVSIKRVAQPRGLASNFVHERVERGTLLDVRAPAGHFYLDLAAPGAIVLLAGGVGITPLLAMVDALVQAGSRRETWLFYGVRRVDEAIQLPHLAQLAREHSWLKVQLCTSEQAVASPLAGIAQHHARVSVALLQSLLPSSNYDYFICGPPPMMTSLVEGLAAWGVPDDRVHFEAFGPASVKRAPAPAASEVGATTIDVEFRRSGKRAEWTPASKSLLELAESCGAAIDSGCRAGNCGSCLVALRRGKVRYSSQPGYPVDEGSCLACVAQPDGPLVVEA